MSLTDRVTRRVEIAVKLDALKANLAAIRQHCSPSKVFAVLKSDAYGHGAVDCARELTLADGFAVVHPNEARQLREAGINLPILVMQGAANLCETQELASLNCLLVIHRLEQCGWIEQVSVSTPVTVWLKTDTGMGRLGLTTDQLSLALRGLHTLSNVTVGGIMSHLAAADETDNPATKLQLNQLLIHTQSAPGVLASLANSAGVLAWPETWLDWVRPGIALYGANPLDIPSPISLAPVMDVSAPLIAVRQMRRGDGIGYGSDFQCPEDMAVGLAGVGYGDGLPRVLVDGTVYLRGQALPIIGRVSMDSIAIDLRPLTSQECTIQAGDNITLWGENHPVEHLAAAAGTISYELFCNIRGLRRLQ